MRTRSGRGPAGGSSAAPGEETPGAAARRAHAVAMKLLGPRDHSSAELRQKLLRRDFDEPAIESALRELRDANHLDDASYAVRYAEQRAAQGHGPLSIRAKLGERGVDGALIGEAIDALEVDWTEAAADALRRKFTAAELADGDERTRGKVARFLQGRGFPGTDSMRAVKICRGEGDRD